MAKKEKKPAMPMKKGKTFEAPAKKGAKKAKC